MNTKQADPYLIKKPLEAKFTGHECRRRLKVLSPFFFKNNIPNLKT
jgi:hypothetical protein